MLDQMIISQSTVQVSKLETHDELKDQTIDCVNNFKNLHVNYNNMHHGYVFESQHDIHNNNLFKYVIESNTVKQLCQYYINYLQPKNFLTFAITESWFTIIPAGGCTLPTKNKGLITSNYFLASHPYSGNIIFDSGLPTEYFEPIADQHNKHFANSSQLNAQTPEGYIFSWPSYINYWHTTNMCNEDKLIYSFVLDLVTK